MAEINFQNTDIFILMTESVVGENEFFFTELRKSVITCLKSVSGSGKVFNDTAISKTGEFQSLSDISVQLQSYTNITLDYLVIIISDDSSCTTRCGVLDFPKNVKLIALNVDYENCDGWEKISDSVKIAENKFTYKDISKLTPDNVVSEITKRKTNNCSTTDTDLNLTYTRPTKKPVIPSCEKQGILPTTTKTDTDSNQADDANGGDLTTNVVIGCLAGFLAIALLACLLVLYRNRKSNRGPDTYRQYSQVDQSVASHEHKLPSIADAYPTTGYDDNHVESVQGWEYEELHIPSYLDIDDPSDRRLSSTRFIPRGPLISSEGEEDQMNIPFGSGGGENLNNSEDSNPYFVLEKPIIVTENEPHESDDIVVNAAKTIKGDDLDTEKNHMDKRLRLPSDSPEQTESLNDQALESEKTVIENQGGKPGDENVYFIVEKSND